MCVVLSTYGSCGDVEPMAGLAAALRESGAEARVCAPPDEEFAKRPAGVGVELVPVGQPVRTAATRAGQPSRAGLAERAAAMTAAQFEAVVAAAEDADAGVATGLLPAADGARTAAGKLGLPYVFAVPEGVTDNRVLHDLDARFMNETFGTGLDALHASIGLPPVADFRTHVLTDRPWPAADPLLGPWQTPADLDVVRTGAWALPDERPLPDGHETFPEAGEAPVYVGFASMPMHGAGNAGQVAVGAVRAQGRSVLVGRGRADLALIDGADDCFDVGEADHQALFRRVAAVVHHGGAGTTTTSALAGVPQVVVPQIADQPYRAGRVAELGIGAAHDGPTPTDVAATIRTDGAEAAARLLLDMAS
ncbi:glycosyltransferase [Streptomyces sp. NPDC048420]|uniref:glycosyltransferase n=1 Tax=Streptomyces sp. NPDC048420 TaxID=3155755 RepID=UPI0034327EDE